MNSAIDEALNEESSSEEEASTGDNSEENNEAGQSEDIAQENSQDTLQLFEYNEATGNDYHKDIKKIGDVILFLTDDAIYSVNQTT